MEKLFVYGTLAPGEPNHHYMTPIKGTWQPASIKGTLYPKGWGAFMGYPGIVPHDKGDVVKGFVFFSDELDAHWERLDEFEGEEYQRTIVNVTLESGETTEAYVYSIRDTTQI